MIQGIRWGRQKSRHIPFPRAFAVLPGIPSPLRVPVLSGPKCLSILFCSIVGIIFPSRLISSLSRLFRSLAPVSPHRIHIQRLGPFPGSNDIQRIHLEHHPGPVVNIFRSHKYGIRSPLVISRGGYESRIPFHLDSGKAVAIVHTPGHG